jgi:hypothetical protein
LDEAFTARTMHQMAEAGQLAAKLAEYSKSAKPLPRADWRDARLRLLAVEAAVQRGDAAGALRRLDDFLAADRGPALAARARRLQQEVRDRELWLAEARRLKDQPEEQGPGGLEAEACRAAVAKALAGDPVSAREALAALLAGAKAGDYPRAVALEKRCSAALADAFEAGRIKTTLLALEGPIQAGDPPDRRRPYGAYWQIGVAFGSEPALAGELTVQYYVRTTDGKVHAGFQTFRDVPRNGNHQAAAYLPVHLLAGRKAPEDQPAFAGIADVRFEVYAGRRLAAFRTLRDEKEPGWWGAAEPRPLVFLEAMEWGWESGTLGGAAGRGLIFAREAKAAPAEPEPPAALQAEVLAWMFGQGIMTELGRPEERHLLALGEAAVEPLARAIDAQNPSHALRCAAILARLGARQGLAPLAEQLKSKQPYVALFALRALGPYGDDRSIPAEAVAALLESGEARVRLAAAAVLGLARDERAAGALLARLKKEPDAQVRAALTGALERTAARDFGVVPAKPLSEQAEAAGRLDEWWAAHGKEPREAWMAAALAEAGYPVGKPDEWPPGRLPDAAEAQVRKAALDRRWLLACAALRLPPPADGRARLAALLDALDQADRDEVRQAALLGLKELADRDSLARVIGIGRAQPALAGHVVRLLEDVTGVFSLPDREDSARHLEAWQAWLAENGPYLYRPKGARRFALDQAAKQAGTPVDPLTGKPQPK